MISTMTTPTPMTPTTMMHDGQSMIENGSLVDKPNEPKYYILELKITMSFAILKGQCEGPL